MRSYNTRKQPIAETATNTVKVVISSVIGSFIGAGTSFAVISTLGEISTNEFFSFYFGMLFIIVGFLLLFRSLDTRYRQLISAKPKILMGIAIMTICSGVSSILLEKDVFKGFTPHAKIPLYALLGITLAFAILFSIVDIINYAAGFCQPSHAKAIVDSKQQLIVIIILSCIMGFLYGVIFAVLDVEDATPKNFAYLIIKDIRLSLPIGFVLGFFGGCYNECHRQTGGVNYDNFQKLGQFEEEL